ATPLVKEGDAAFEKLLAEEEAMELSTQEQNEAPNFRPGDSD
ncbi:MAG: 30S ribosomal protein S3, partial [Actinobacteria bacterium]|nr:30S ribosomal protein S3 [Actinomycetota bacterium]